MNGFGTLGFCFEEVRAMSIKVNVDESRELVEIVFAGEVTKSEFIELMDRYFREPSSAFPLGLFDLSDVTGVDVAAESVRDAARRAGEYVDSRLDGGKLAIVAPRDLLFGMARMYEILRGDSPVEVRVFREREEAESWLGITNRATVR
jgi:hypothetical protein